MTSRFAAGAAAARAMPKISRVKERMRPPFGHSPMPVLG
jgi:hypothetical protein